MELSGEILIGEERIRERVESIARAVAADTPEGVPLSVVAILDGAFVFASDLVRRLAMPVRLALVPVRSVERGGDPSAMALPEDFPVEGAEVLIVEDILDTGRTLAAVRDALLARGPRRVRIAVFLDKAARRAVPVHADYVGFDAPDVWVVGYGLDADGLYRNLPYLTYAK